MFWNVVETIIAIWKQDLGLWNMAFLSHATSFYKDGDKEKRKTRKLSHVSKKLKDLMKLQMTTAVWQVKIKYQ